jgi:hypothetical protein
MKRIVQSLAVAGWAVAMLSWGAGVYHLEYVIGNQPLEPVGEYSVPMLVEGTKHYATTNQQFYDALANRIFFWALIFSAVCTALHYGLSKIQKGPVPKSEGVTRG